MKVLEAEGLVKRFPVGGQLTATRGGRRFVHAVEGVSFTIAAGQILGLVGESGSGKSTVANCVARLIEPTAGTIRLQGHDITHLSRRQMRPHRRQLHMVLQDPRSSLNPRWTAERLVAEPLRLHRLAVGSELDRRVTELFRLCGLSPQLRLRFPHELSGGQRQRLALARALSVEPALLIADEAVSALDVSVQASILNLLRDLQRDMGFSCLFISHDLQTVEFLCDQVAVMYLGRIVETGSREQLLTAPQHPYTQALMASALVADPKAQRVRTRVPLTGEMPSSIDPPSGCVFRTRCALATGRCEREIPPLTTVSPDHACACHVRAEAVAQSSPAT